MPEDCLFCRIAVGKEPSVRVAEGDEVIAIRDKFPRAPVHVLVLPVRHVSSIHELDDDGLLARLVGLARQVAVDEGVSDGYRIATNVGRGGGQAFAHLHLHVVGGRQLGHIDDGDPPAG